MPCDTVTHVSLQVWRVLTDYDSLADFVPNLLACERTPCPNPGRIRLRQRGCSQSVFLRLEAQAVLELQEVHKPMNRRELHFLAVEGDFEVCLWRRIRGCSFFDNHAFQLRLAVHLPGASVDKFSTALRCQVLLLCVEVPLHRAEHQLTLSGTGLSPCELKTLDRSATSLRGV